MKNRVKPITLAITTLTIICLVTIVVCNQLVVNNAKGKVFSDLDSIKYNKVGLLLGTTPQARIGRITNYFFVYRIDAAEQLYKAGKIEKILISGDEHSLDGINEPECMRDSLVARGVPSNAIILDGKGYGQSIRLSIWGWNWRTFRLSMRRCQGREEPISPLSVNILQE